MHSSIFKWNYVRLCLVAFGTLQGFFYVDPDKVGVFPLEFTQLLVIFLFIPFALNIVLGLQFLNKQSAKIWKSPSWFLNPFNFKQPLQFFHFAAFFSISFGLSALISLVWKGSNCIYQAALPLSIGVGLLIGIHCALLIFKNKIESSKTYENIYRFWE